MNKSPRILLVVAGMVIITAIGGLFYLYNEEQQMTKQQASASLDQGIALFREKKYAESLEVFQGIPDGVIKDWHLPYYTATAQVMLKDYQPAAAKLEEALVLNPQETQIMFELGVVYYKLGKLELSKGYFASVVEIDPSNEEAKGLMDIMANLERQQPAASGEDAPQQGNNGADGN